MMRVAEPAKPTTLPGTVKMATMQIWGPVRYRKGDHAFFNSLSARFTFAATMQAQGVKEIQEDEVAQPPIMVIQPVRA